MMKSLEDLIVRPELQLEGIATGDLLSQVLSQIRLTGDCVYSYRLQAKGRMPLERRAAHVCVLEEGRLKIARGNEPPATIDAGDLFLLPRDAEDLRVTAVEGPASLVVCQSCLQSLLWLLTANRLQAFLSRRAQIKLCGSV